QAGSPTICMHIALLAGANWVHWLTSVARAFCSSVRHPVALCALEYCCKSALQLLRTSYVGTSSAFATLAWTPRDTAAIATTIPSFVMFGLHQANLKVRFQYHADHGSIVSEKSFYRGANYPNTARWNAARFETVIVYMASNRIQQQHGL